jgi:hypothetical protein
LCVEYFLPAWEFNALMYAGVTKVSNPKLKPIYITPLYFYFHYCDGYTHISDYSVNNLARPRVIFLLNCHVTTIDESQNLESRCCSSLPHTTLSRVFCNPCFRITWYNIFSRREYLHLCHCRCKILKKLQKRYRFAYSPATLHGLPSAEYGLFE